MILHGLIHLHKFCSSTMNSTHRLRRENNQNAFGSHSWNLEESPEKNPAKYKIAVVALGNKLRCPICMYIKKQVPTYLNYQIYFVGDKNATVLIDILSELFDVVSQVSAVSLTKGILLPKDL